MTIGERIKETRQNKGMSQKKLAERLGVSSSMVSQYESGTRQPRIDTIKRIAEALDANVYELIGFPSESPIVVGDKVYYSDEPTSTAAFQSAASFSKLMDFLDMYGVFYDTKSNEFIFTGTWEHFPLNQEQITMLPPVIAEQAKALIKTLHKLQPEDEKDQKPSDQENGE